MFKSPITKTGELRFVELIKFGVLVSFFYALTSFATDQKEFIVSNANLAYIAIFTVLVVITSLLALVHDFIQLMRYIKSLNITWISVPTIDLKPIQTKTVRFFESLIVLDITQPKLCVIRS